MASSGVNTTISSNFTLPSSMISVASTAGFSSLGGTLAIQTTSGYAFITYTGISGNSFTGCTGNGGSGSVTTGGNVYQASVLQLGYSGLTSTSFTNVSGGAGLGAFLEARLAVLPPLSSNWTVAQSEYRYLCGGLRDQQ